MNKAGVTMVMIDQMACKVGFDIVGVTSLKACVFSKTCGERSACLTDIEAVTITAGQFVDPSFLASRYRIVR